MHEHHELTDFQKGEIVGMRRSSSPTKISRELDIPQQTISSFLQRFNERGSIDNLKHPGRPRKTSAREDRYVIHTAESETRIPLKELRDKTNRDVSEQTVRRRLREAGIRKWKAVQRPLLTKRHAALRLKWARAHQHWTKEDWEKVGWSDECGVKRDNSGEIEWVFRRQNKQEKYKPENIRGKQRDGGILQMIWGCFIGNKLGPIAFINSTINKDVYVDLLREFFLPFIDALNADGITDIIFQQDNAPPHVAGITREFLKTTGNEHGFTFIEWPPNSPDMNPIEHLWAHLKLELYRQYPDTTTLKGSPNTIKTILRPRLNKLWWNIGESVLEKLVESMPRRVQALINAKGWYTEY